MCLRKTDAPGSNKVKIWQNLFVLHFDSPQRYVMSGKCEQPFKNLQSKFGYCMTTPTLNIALCKRDGNIYTPCVFCYNKHKKNFDIHFSMKKKRDVWAGCSSGCSEYPPVVYLKRIFHSQNGTILIKYKEDKDRGSTCKFRKALCALQNLHVNPLSFIPPWETNKKNLIPNYGQTDGRTIWFLDCGGHFRPGA